MITWLRQTIRRIPWLKAALLPVVNEGQHLAFSVRKLVEPMAESPPLNGQERRCACFDALLEEVAPQVIAETGTYRASTTLYLANRVACPVYTIDANKYFVLAARVRTALQPRVRVLRGDSMLLLRELARLGACGKRTFFYLDAHWGERCPLQEEVHFILERWKEALVCVDDFRVEDDPGYRFDRYGSIRLDIDYLRLPPHVAVDVYYPAAPSKEETGAVRGAVYLALGEGVRRIAANLAPAHLRRLPPPRPLAA
jgi:hypothetical protein